MTPSEPTPSVPVTPDPTVSPDPTVAPGPTSTPSPGVTESASTPSPTMTDTTPSPAEPTASEPVSGGAGGSGGAASGAGGQGGTSSQLGEGGTSTEAAGGAPGGGSGGSIAAGGVGGEPSEVAAGGAGGTDGTVVDDGRGPHAPTTGEIVVLYDGSGFDAWEPYNQGLSEVNWTEYPDEGSMEVMPTGGNHIVTNEANWHQDVFLHIEFASPDESADQTGQNRGNSGIYLQSRYELQVLDSYGRPPEIDGCGAIYKVSAPLVNACMPASEWNTYEIDFTAPRFENGTKIENARVTAWLNDQLVQDDVDVPGPTEAGVAGESEGPHPLYLQDHSDTVRYRNIWWIHK